MKAKKYALWLIPDEANRNQFAALIEKLSHRHNTPLFQPHVTLLAGMEGSINEIAHNTADLLHHLHTLKLQSTYIDTLDEYYRCLFIRIADSMPQKQFPLLSQPVSQFPQGPVYPQYFFLR